MIIIQEDKITNLDNCICISKTHQLDFLTLKYSHLLMFKFENNLNYDFENDYCNFRHSIGFETKEERDALFEKIIEGKKNNVNVIDLRKV